MRRRALALIALAVLMLGGCGIPDSTDVKVLGDGQAAGPAQDIDAPPPRPVTRSSTGDVATFVGNYLKAAAGDPDGAVQRAKEFMDSDFAATFKPSTSDITVVRPTEQPLVNSGSPYVSLNVEQVGTLKENGELVPLAHPAQTEKLHFTVTSIGDKGLFIAKADPPVLVLSDVGLTTYYQQHTIYFWNSDNTGLVPDVRYMPLSVPSAQQPTVILNWLAGGPADWLPPAAVPLPQGTAPPPDNIPAISNDELQVKLNSQGPAWDAAELDRLAQQLQWSLRPLTPKTLELTVGHQSPVKFSGEQNSPDANPASRLLDDPDRFVVYNGVIRRLSESPHAVSQVPVLKPAANKGVQSAAMSSQSGQTLAAVVSVAGKDKAPALRVASAPSGKEADLRAVHGLKGTLGHPAWVVAGSSDADGAVGLITVNNHLFSFSADGSDAQPVEWQQGGDPGAISAFSVAPDGHRIALASGGKLLRAVLTVGSDGVVVMSSPSQIDTPGLSSITAVAWSSEGWLVVAGVNKNRRVSIYDVSIDGSQSAMRLDDIGDESITYLTAYPINPLTHSQLSDAKVAYVIAGAAGIAAGYPVPIKTADLAGPANSPSSSTSVLTSPFFLN
ncbi:MAG TPA: LpqB family beta-propeller domain-containing protein [Actinoplanes sp.]|jgi:hypothetical protein